MEVSEQVVGSIANEIARAKGWIKFIGIVMIIGGAINALTIVGIVFAWLPIWMGVLLTQVAGAGQKFIDERDMNALQQIIAKLRVFFLIQGIAIIVGIILAIVMVVFYVIFGLALLGILTQSQSI